MNKVLSSLPVNYTTIKVTKSRIEKGLLAIPVSLIDMFPQNQHTIYIVDGDTIEEKTFTSYHSTSRECRIGGMKLFYQKYDIHDSDELVIQSLDNTTFRIIPEKLFKYTLLNTMNRLYRAKTDNEVEESITRIAQTTNTSKTTAIKNQFIYLSHESMQNRKKIIKSSSYVNETVPCSIRKLLLELYGGKCQLTGFTFLMKNSQPYFELHHITPDKGNHVKNLLVVSPNIHAQFTYCDLKQVFDEQGWLRQVSFNNKKFTVFQIIDSLSKTFEKEIHF